MTVDRDLATLRNPWGLMPDVVTAAADRVETELARLREGLRPFVEEFDFRAADYLADDERTVALLIEYQSKARALLADTPDHAPPHPR